MNTNTNINCEITEDDVIEITLENKKIKLILDEAYMVCDKLENVLYNAKINYEDLEAENRSLQSEIESLNDDLESALGG